MSLPQNRKTRHKESEADPECRRASLLSRGTVGRGGLETASGIEYMHGSLSNLGFQASDVSLVCPSNYALLNDFHEGKGLSAVLPHRQPSLCWLRALRPCNRLMPSVCRRLPAFCPDVKRPRSCISTDLPALCRCPVGRCSRLQLCGV